MKFKWSKKYSVKIKSLDEQHKNFFNLANKILDIVKKKEISQHELLRLVSEFGNYALYHLSTEEEYFKKCNYQDPLHIQAHNAYREKMNSLHIKIRQGDRPKKIAEDLANYAINWLTKHILVMDKKYSEPLIKCGVK
jgi:hemerythrin-like metal-binding protein